MINNRFLMMMVLAFSLPSFSTQASPPPNTINAAPAAGKVGVLTSFSYTLTYTKVSTSPVFQISYSKTGEAPWKVIKFSFPYSSNYTETTIGTTVTRIAMIGSYKPVAADVSKNGVIRVCEYAQSDLKNPVACVSSPFSVAKKVPG